MKTLTDLIGELSPEAAGNWMYDRVREYYPWCRSITGDGLRQTLQALGDHIPLELHEVATGTPVFDWTIPNEWNVREAWIEDPKGNKVVDFRDHNLHLLGYSAPFKGRVSRQELVDHCFTLPDHPDWIPYRTSYFKEQWGFCLTQNQLDALPEGDYEVCIDTTLAPGHLTYGECVVPGSDPGAEILISAHACHPSLANDNLSGIALALYLARELANIDHRYTYRFIFAPGTIGAIAWLARNADNVDHIKHGLIFACVGDGHAPTYKQSRRGDAVVDKAVAHVLAQTSPDHTIKPFTPYGYDERQYCSPGFNLPVGCFMRSGPGGYPEYHSSADNLDLVQPEALADSLDKVLRVLEVLEGNATYRNLNPHCEPQLGKRGLYSLVGGRNDTQALQMALLWVLNYSDGENSLLDIAQRAEMPFAQIRAAADALIEADLLKRC
jgi:aminopeptidase-like protein